MNFLRLFKKYRQVETSKKVFENGYMYLLKENRALKGELSAARAELQGLSASTAPRPIKVPHCSTCPYHARFNNAGKYAHRCNSVGCMISGNDTRTSPQWCPLRNNNEVSDES